MAMLRKGERVSKARKVLTDALDRVCDRTARVLKGRRDAANQDFNAERVKDQLRQIEARGAVTESGRYPAACCQ